jgi:hypothetical protein
MPIGKLGISQRLRLHCKAEIDALRFIISCWNPWNGCSNGVQQFKNINRGLRARIMSALRIGGVFFTGTFLLLVAWWKCLEASSYEAEIDSMVQAKPIICRVYEYQGKYHKFPESFHDIQFFTPKEKEISTGMEYDKKNGNEFEIHVNNGFDPVATYYSSTQQWSSYRKEKPSLSSRYIPEVKCN